MTGPTSKRSRSSSSVSDAQLDERNATPSDQKSRERKSDPYRDPRYETLLGAKGSFLKDSRAGVLAADSKFCMTLLNFKKKPPSDTLFDDRFFAETMDKIQNENEARVVRDIGQLISPSAECLATRGIRILHLLKESTNAGWNQCIPFEGPRPQPDFCVGFERNAFSDDQLKKLGFDPYAKTRRHRQNAHSMTVAVRGIVELYRIVGRAQELHRKVLGFSLSHDHRTVKIYSHYAEIDGPGTTYYRHVLEEFAILGREAYQFVLNVYGSFVPIHLKRIKSAINQLPDPALSTFSSIQSTEKAVSSQDKMLASAHLSQDVNFNKPTPRRLGPVADLRAQLEMLRQEAKEEKEELRVQNKRLQAQVAQLIDLLAQGREKASNNTGSLSK
ncbi:MAG: hypothetical protein Q9177_003882 [Variospora cf. flavescens]